MSTNEDRPQNNEKTWTGDTKFMDWAKD